MTDAERRNHSRFPFSSRLEVRQRRAGLTPSGEDVQRVARAMAVDVSVGGLGFRSPLPLTIGDVISVSLTDADGPNAGLGVESPTAPRPAQSTDLGDRLFEIIAVVRHVQRDGRDFVIGAERRADS